MHDRCPWAIRYDGNLHTRCRKPEHSRSDSHVGRSLPGQTVPGLVYWLWHDKRSYRTERRDEYAWREE